MSELAPLNIEQVFDIARSLGIPVGDYDPSTGNFIGYSNTQSAVREPEYPKQISSIPDWELGDLLHQQSEWAGYLSERLSEFIAQLRIYKEQKDRVERKLLLESQQAKVTTRKAEARVSPEFIEVNGKIAILEAIVDLIQAAINKANGRYANLSRQISLRGQDVDRTQRNNNSSWVHKTQATPTRTPTENIPPASSPVIPTKQGGRIVKRAP